MFSILKMKFSPKFIAILLLLSIPFNFIVIEGIGNLYLSTLIIFIEFVWLLFITQGGFLLNQNVLFAILIFSISLLSTVINILFFDEIFLKGQINNSIIYFQVLLTFTITSYFYNKINFSYFISLFILVVFFASVRVIIEEPQNVFKLSTLWGERIEAIFIGGVNNFALFLGLAFIMSFFHFKNKTLKIVSCFYFLMMIILTMSRGALLGVILTLFITSLYDTNRATFRSLITYSLYSLLSGLLVLYITGYIDEVLEKVKTRFFSLFTGEQGVNVFFSGRGDLIEDIFMRFSNGSFFQIAFGYGNGGINFYNHASAQYYETSHNILIDILFRNGIILFLIYLVILTLLIAFFIRNRNREKLTLFSVFVFFHLELLVNPVLFAAQVGWVYAIFMVYFLKQNRIFSTTTMS